MAGSKPRNFNNISLGNHHSLPTADKLDLIGCTSPRNLRDTSGTVKSNRTLRTTPRSGPTLSCRTSTLPPSHGLCWLQIQWTQLAADTWKMAATSYYPPAPPIESTTETFKHIGRQIEHYASSTFQANGLSPLPATSKGRGQRLKPIKRLTEQLSVRPSRPGEVQLSSDTNNHSILKWFKQLRRLQSLLHSLRSGGASPTHIAHQLKLWHAIKHAAGFQWLHHLVAYPPTSLPRSAKHSHHGQPRRSSSWTSNTTSGPLKAGTIASAANSRPATSSTATSPSNRSNPLEDGDLHHHYIQTDTPPTPHQEAHWSINGLPVTIDNQERMPCGFTYLDMNSLRKSPSSTLTPSTTSSQPSQTETPPQVWERVVAFTRAYIPQGILELPPLVETSWCASFKRFKKHSARGPDGIAGEDLRHLEGADCPEQLLQGVAHPIAKVPNAETVAQYRPIIVLATTYRSWSSTRARAILRSIGRQIDGRTFGFLPGREAQEIWVLLQALIEVQADTTTPLADIQRARNNLPRRHIHHLLLHRPPEKLPLGLASLSEHLCPTVQAPTHNWGASALIQKISRRMFTQLRRHGRNLLGTRRLSKTVRTSNLPPLLRSTTWNSSPTTQLYNKDLGGLMHYDAKRRTQHLHHQIQLQPQWDLLRRLSCPIELKKRVIIQAFWPKLFHSAIICDHPPQIIHQLRTTVMKTLGWQQAGANSLVSLGVLVKNPLLDPGLFQLWTSPHAELSGKAPGRTFLHLGEAPEPNWMAGRAGPDPTGPSRTTT